MVDPTQFDSYEEYKEYMDYVKRQAAKTQSMKNIEADAEGYRATSGMSTADKFFAGMGAGAKGVGRRAVNLALPRSLEPEWATEEAIKEQRRMDEDLTSTTPGSLGKMAGEIAVTLPVGGAIGAAGKGLSSARALPSLARAGQALSTPTGYGARAAVAGLEGAGQAALTSEPGTGLKETLIGGGLGAGMGAAGKLVGATARKLRPEITEDARSLMAARAKEITDNLAAQGITDPKAVNEALKKGGIFVPASQALPEGSIGRQLNEGLIANLPGSGGVIRGQRNKAVETVRQDIVEKAVPEGFPPETIIDTGDKMSDALPKLAAAWDSAYDDVYQQMIPGVQINPELSMLIRKSSADINGKPRIKTQGDLTGREALDLSQAIQQVINEMPRGALNKAARADLQAQRKALEDHIVNSLPPDIADKFVKNRESYKNFLAVKDAAKKAVGSEFSLRQAERSLAKKGGSAQGTAQLGAQVLRDFPSRQGIFQTLASTGAVAGGAGAAGFFAGGGDDATVADRLRNAAVMATLGMAGPRLAATERGQRLLVQYGDQGVLDKYAKGLRKFGQAGRAGVVNTASQMQEE